MHRPGLHEQSFSKSTMTETVTQLLNLKGLFHRSQCFFHCMLIVTSLLYIEPVIYKVPYIAAIDLAPCRSTK